MTGCRVLGLAAVLSAGFALDVAAQPQAGWRLDPVPVVDIAGVSSASDVVLAFPSGATVLSDGTIVVADRHSWAVRYFNRQGRLARSAGRQGDGPGEFQAIYWLGKCASDTTVAWDFTQRRMSALDPQGKVVRQMRLPLNTGDPRPYLFECSSTGRFAFLEEPSFANAPQRPNESARLPASLVIADATGRVVTTIGQFATREFTMVARVNAPMPRPLGRETSIALADDRIFVGTADSSMVEFFTLDGKRLATIRLRDVTRRPTTANTEAAVDQLASYETDPAWQMRLKELFLAMPMPERLPPYADILTDRLGLLWVVRSFPGDTDTRLEGYSMDGTIQADVRVPRFLTVYEIGSDYILGSFEDQAGFPHVAMYRLNRASR